MGTSSEAEARSGRRLPQWQRAGTCV